MKTAADLADGRDNHFNLIRFIAASAVVYTHSLNILGLSHRDILYQCCNITLGALAVDVFFVISGFLLTRSWLQQPVLPTFFIARALRIFPALWVSVAICALVIGPIFTTVSLSEYFRSADLLKFVISNVTLYDYSYQLLPGVFTDHLVELINPPLWTLPFEFRMYLLLMLLGVTGLLRKPIVSALVMGTGYLIFFTGWFYETAWTNDWPNYEYGRFMFFFFSGSLLWHMRAWIPVNLPVIAALVVAMLALMISLDSADQSRFVLALFTPVLTIMTGLLPFSSPSFIKLHDFSYGLYIYHYPVQHLSVEFTEQSVSPLLLFAISFPLSLVLAMMSWFLLERHALTLKSKIHDFVYPFRLRLLQRRQT